MSIIDKFKGLLNPEDMNDGYVEQEYVFDTPAADEYSGGGYEGNTEYADPQGQAPTASFNPPRAQAAPSGTGYGAGQGVSINGSALELKVIKPKQWKDVNTIADHLISHRTVVLNLEDTNTETTHRMLDFLLGVVYTIEGDIKKVATNTYVITPNNVMLSQEQQNAAGAARTASDPYNSIGN